MVHSFGKRARTRSKFSKGFRRHGVATTSRLITTYRRGDYVDVVCDPSQTKAMPFHYYHGKTGVVFDVNRKCVGVQIKKVVRHREILKRFHVRVEHVRPSRCKEEFKKRMEANKEIIAAAKARGEFVTVRRVPKQPKTGGFVAAETIQDLEALPFVEDY